MIYRFKITCWYLLCRMFSVHCTSIANFLCGCIHTQTPWKPGPHFLKTCPRNSQLSILILKAQKVLYKVSIFNASIFNGTEENIQAFPIFVHGKLAPVKHCRY